MSGTTSKSRNKRPDTPLITSLYEHLKVDPGRHFTVEELSREFKMPASSVRRSLTRSVRRQDMYPGLYAYDDGTYAWTTPKTMPKPTSTERKARTVKDLSDKIQGNTQTETFDPPAATPINEMETDKIWMPGMTMEVIGQLPRGEVVVLSGGTLHLVSIIEIGSIEKHLSF